MKTSICLLVIGCLSNFIINPAFTQPPSFEWVKQIKGANEDKSNSLAVDGMGNIYIVGEFEGEVDFDPGIDTFFLTSMGSKDIFIQKMDLFGNFIWAKQMGGTGFDIGRSITVDQEGNVYTTGYFQDDVDFDPGQGEFILSASLEEDNEAFIQKLDTDGNFMWVQRISGLFSDIGTSINIDAFGNIYTVGIFVVSADFDPGPDSYILNPIGSSDVFIQKLDDSGNFLWAKNVGGIKPDFGLDATVDEIGNIYITGRFHETVDFDPGPEVFNLSATGDWDIFMQKLDADGTFLWAIQIGGANSDSCNSIAVDKSENVYATGFFTREVDFDPGPGTFFLDSGLFATQHDIFVLKLDSSGQLIWAKRMGTDPALDYGSAITIDTFGNVYTTGTFFGEADFDPGPGTHLLNSVDGGAEAFIQKLDEDGNFIWAVNIGGTSWDESKSIKVDNFRNIYTTGFFYESADFDPGLDTFELTSDGSADIFVHKMHQCTFDASISSNKGFEVCAGESTDLTAVGGEYYMWDTGDTSATIIVTPSITTTFNVAITDTSSCTRIQSVQIIVEPHPNAQFDYSVNGTTVDFTNLSSSNANNFEWNFGDNSPESSEENPTHTYTQSGVYLVTLIATNPFCGSAISQYVEVLPTSIKSFDDKSLIEIFPNPVTDLLHFKSEIKIDHIQISNILGQQVLEIKDAENSNKIDLKHLLSGNYVITFLSGDQIWSSEFVKQ